MSDAPVTAEDLYLYAMHLLEPAEHARLESFLQQSSEARAELSNVRGDLALLALTTEAHVPPPAAKQRLLREIAREPRVALAPAPAAAQQVPAAAAIIPVTEDRYTPAAEPARSVPAYEGRGNAPRGFFASLFPWAGWAVAAGLAATTFTFYQRSQSLAGRTAALQNSVEAAHAEAESATAASAKAQQVLDVLRSGSAQHFTLVRANTKPVPSARVTYVAEKGLLVFQGSDLEALPSSKTYELWLIPKGTGAKPVPAGLFKPDARGYASVLLPALPTGLTVAAFGVTVEDDGGSPAPTLPILLAGS